MPIQLASLVLALLLFVSFGQCGGLSCVMDDALWKSICRLYYSRGTTYCCHYPEGCRPHYPLRCTSNSSYTYDSSTNCHYECSTSPYSDPTSIDCSTKTDGGGCASSAWIYYVIYIVPQVTIVVGLICCAIVVVAVVCCCCMARKNRADAFELAGT